jgi:hypothetical protein
MSRPLHSRQACALARVRREPRGMRAEFRQDEDAVRGAKISRFVTIGVELKRSVLWIPGRCRTFFPTLAHRGGQDPFRFCWGRFSNTGNASTRRSPRENRMHQGQGQAVDPSSVPAPRKDAGLPAPFLAKPGLVVVPTNEHFQLVRAEAQESGKVHELHRMVSAMQAAAAKCDLAHEEMVRLAEFRLQLERDLGVYLAQHVHRGGDRANGPRVRLLLDGGLPEWVTHRKSASYRELASIPEDVFRDYLEEARKKRQVPSSRGARSFAGGKKPASGRAKGPGREQGSAAGSAS